MGLVTVDRQGEPSQGLELPELVHGLHQPTLVVDIQGAKIQAPVYDAPVQSNAEAAKMPESG